MTNVVQALPPKPVNAHARQSAESPLAGRGFSDALQGDTARSPKPGFGTNAEAAPASLPPMLRLPSARHDFFPPRLLTEHAGREMTAPRSAKGTVDEAIETDRPTNDEPSSDEASGAMPDALLSLLVAAPRQSGSEADGSVNESASTRNGGSASGLAATSAPLHEKTVSSAPTVPVIAREMRGGRPATASAPAFGEEQPEFARTGLPPAGPAARASATGEMAASTALVPPGQEASWHDGGKPEVGPKAGRREASEGFQGLLPPRERMPSTATKQTDKLPQSVHVLDSQNLPAPAQSSSPAATVSSAIAASPDWLSAARSASVAGAGASTSQAGPLKSLTIQLHPAELGSVTAKMRLAGEQLSIELQVEKAEAYDRLAADRDAIIKAVRALGIEVDRVTIQQAAPQSPVQTRTDAGPSFGGGAGREADFTPGGSGGGESGGGAAAGRARETDDDGQSSRPAAGHGARADGGRGLYI